MKKLYKFLNLKGKTIKSNSGNTKWKIGEWLHEDDISMCNKGFHASKTPYQAFSYVQGNILAIVEVKGKSIKQKDKEVWSDMKIIKAYKWTKKDSVAFAIYAAELVLSNYEKQYPNDKRPREAIEAARKVLCKDTAKNRAAAWSAARSAASSAAASAAHSAWSAQSAAESAAWSAAWSAARSAAWSARSAAWSAASSAASSAEWSAEWYAAGSATHKKLSNWMIKRIKELDEI